MYKNCIFDLYGTLVDIHTNEKKEELWEKLAMLYRYYGADYETEELRTMYAILVKGKQKKAAEAALSTVYIHSNISPDEPLPKADQVLKKMDMEKLTKILLECV